MLKQWNLLLLCPFLLTACSKDKDYAPEKFQEQALERQATGYYIVKEGDTLSAIGAAYGISYLKLALWNHLPPPYHLSIGQKIQLFNSITQQKPSLLEKNPKKKIKQPSPSFTTYTVKKGDTLYSIGRRFGVDHDVLAGLNNLPSAEYVYEGQILKIFKPKQKHTASDSAKNSLLTTKNLRFRPHKNSIISNNNKNMLKFYCQLPIEGKILKNFAQTDNRGIEIAGNLGQKVKAAASGRVVAVHSVLYGYGETIVIQHNNTYMSSYSNNRRALVKEGQQVKKGQVIAEVGQIGRNRPSVRFEIRKKGKLVNPMNFLSK